MASSNADRARRYAEWIRAQGRDLPEKVFMPRFRMVAFKVLEVAIQNTPVDRGRLRNGWHLTIGTPSGEDRGKEGDPTALSEGQGVIAKAKFGESLWIQNNVPYAAVYEYGLFQPKDPGVTDWGHLPKTAREKMRKAEPVVLIRGGFHVSAPDGMLADAVQVVATEMAAGTF